MSLARAIANSWLPDLANNALMVTEAGCSLAMDFVGAQNRTVRASSGQADAQGSNSTTSIPTKSRMLRVTSVRPCRRAMAAI